MTDAQPPRKKGLPTAAWIAIGCGGLFVIAVIAIFGLGFFAVQKGKEVVAESTGSESFSDFMDDLRDNPAKKTAEAMIALDPDLELISTNDEEGTITFVNNRTGERATLDFEDIAEGRFSVTTDEGEYRVDASSDGEGGVTLTGPDGETRLGASADLGDVPDWVPLYPRAASSQSLQHTVSAAGVSGLTTTQTADGAQQVFDHYKSFFADNGWNIGSQSMTTTGDGSYGAITAQRDGRSVNVAINQGEQGCQVTINYNG